MNRKAIGALLLACALACATLFAVSIASANFLDLIHTLTPGSRLLIQPLLALAAAICLGLGVFLRRRTANRGEA
jgi:polyferredoxin